MSAFPYVVYVEKQYLTSLLNFGAPATSEDPKEALCMSEHDALQVADDLRKVGFVAKAILYPTHQEQEWAANPASLTATHQ